ncbi:MAG TPA: hypothetical protein VN915_00090 [Elusimicrobiota bacterium]|nr:hypothetical protein [Elusimicrobiota bacterium]
MASKADAFKYLEARSGPKKARRPDRDWPARPGGARPADERQRHGRTASRNFSLHAEREAPYSLEDSPAGKPSRRSTRRSANRMKASRPAQLVKLAQGHRARLSSGRRVK